ncbi:MAG TPA: PAS domain-containing sensor histidine kinase [Candidatus Xenobia bacterium]|nr:PAS domain-containing sensor histidine kinase [Candidatus Xenobia bacterium]
MSRPEHKHENPEPLSLGRPARAEDEIDRFFRVSLDLLCIAGFDGYFKRLNPAWETALGWSLGELVSVPYIEFVHPDDRVATLAEAKKLTTGKLTLTFENRYRCKDGSYRWLQWNVVPVPEQEMLYAAARDITHLKEAEEQLQRYAAEISDLYNNAPCGYHSLNPDGVFVRINDTELKWLGYRREEIVGKKRFVDLVTLDGQKRFPELFAGFKRRGWVRDLEFDMVRKDGTVLPVIINSVAVWDTAGNYQMSRSTVFDNTDRKALERAKDEFLSMVGHELRNPITTLRAGLSLLATGKLGELTPKGQHLLQIAVEDTERLTRLVNDMVDMQRLKLGRFTLSRQSCDAALLVHQAADAVHPLAEKAGIRLEVTAESAPVWADPDRVVQTLTNLLTNAIRFSPKDSVVKARVAPQSSGVLFQVIDQGCGIEKEMQEAVFERFRQAKATAAQGQGGLGLGLAVCRGIVEQHGGKIWVESEPGQGSTFSFSLPTTPEKDG